MISLGNLGDSIGFHRAPPTTGGASYSEKMRIEGASGNVGIGTTVPSQKLDVAGTAKMTGFQLTTGAATDKVLTSDASGVGTWQTSQGTGPQNCQIKTNTGNAGQPVVATCPVGYAIMGGGGSCSQDVDIARIRNCPASSGSCVGNQGPPITANQWMFQCTAGSAGSVIPTAYAICCPS